MTRTAMGADDRYTVRQYLAGEEYLVGADLAREFVSNGDAVPCDAGAAAPDPAPAAISNAFAKFDHDGDGRPGGSLPGRRKKDA
jgi:hypothetical protein